MAKISIRELVLREQLKMLERETKRVKRALAAFEHPTQAPLLPDAAATAPLPRALSQQQHDLEEFEDARRTRIEEIGAVEHIEDDKHHPLFVNVVMKKIRDACGGDTDRTWAVFDSFLAEQWPAKYEPPYGFKYLANEKTWREHVEKVVRKMGPPPAPTPGDRA